MPRFETKKQKVLPFNIFLIRLLKYFFYASLIVAVSMALGVWGYMHYANLTFIDSFHMAALILTGMGPVVEMKTVSAKLFSSFYALYSGVAFLTMIATFLAPILHRLLHVLHLDDED